MRAYDNRITLGWLLISIIANTIVGKLTRKNLELINSDWISLDAISFNDGHIVTVNGEIEPNQCIFSHSK